LPRACQVVWFNGRVGARLISTRDASKVIELVGGPVTIGRGAECEFQIADDRISTRHCRLSGHSGAWAIEDLRSTNRTFVNGELVGEQPRRLGHGDIVRLGAQDAVLFEARFVEARFEVAERMAEPRRPAVHEEALQRKIAELQAALLERNAEIVRVGAMYRELQAQRSAQLTASAASERVRALMTSELEAVREELERERREHAAGRDAEQRAQHRVAELEAQLAAQDRKARSEINDGNLRSKELESKLRMALSDLALAREALAIANDSIRSLKQVCEDQRIRLEAGSVGRGSLERSG
jgi:pSer/pThr/pTyr-binding forkhead associated (FHA) protein